MLPSAGSWVIKSTKLTHYIFISEGCFAKVIEQAYRVQAYSVVIG